MSTINYEPVSVDWKAWSEQCIKARNRSCCFWGCPIPSVCFVALLFCLVNFNVFGIRYPIMLKGDFMNEVYRKARASGEGITFTVGGDTDVNEWIKKDGADQLFVGTWKLEDPVAVASFFSFPDHIPGWEKTRLKIRPDYTFTLTDPYENMDWLHGFRGEVTGTWRAYIGDQLTLSIYFTPETIMPSGTTPPLKATIRDQGLWTLRTNVTSDKYLRLQPGWGYFDDFQRTPSWKKVIEE